MTVSLRDWETSIVDIDLKDYHPQKAVDFLNKLVEVYRIDNVEKKTSTPTRPSTSSNTSSKG